MTLQYDSSKPTQYGRLNSTDIRNNFTALNRANDLRPSENPAGASLHVYVQAGRFIANGIETQSLTAQLSPILDTTTGGVATQKRIAVLLVDNNLNLYWKYGNWHATTATAAAYDFDTIAICEVTFTYNDTTITDDMIRDVRPFLNLGGTSPMNPGAITIVAFNDEGGGAQRNFDTSVVDNVNSFGSSFTYIKDENEILVYVNGVYKTVTFDYVEVPEILMGTVCKIVRFNVGIPLGQVVTVWKIGLAARPGDMSFEDLSDIDSNQSGAFHAADAPTQINPFLTESGHAAVDHSLIAPVDDLLTRVGTAETNLANHIPNLLDPIPSVVHDAVEIRVQSPPSYSPTGTEVQKVLDDLDTNFYNKMASEHILSGTQHGPRVNINQNNDDNVLVIGKVHSGPANAVVISNSGSGYAINVSQTSTISSTAFHVINAASTSTRPLTHLENYASGPALQVDQKSTNYALYVTNTSASLSPAVFISNNAATAGVLVSQNGNATAIQIDKTSTGSTPALLINNSSSGSGYGVRIRQGGESTAVRVEKSAIGSQPVISVANSGTGKDIEGNAGNWSVDRLGNASFASVLPTMQQQVFTFTWNNASTAFSTGALGFTPKHATAMCVIAWPGDTRLHAMSTGFATGIGTLARSVASNDYTDNDNVSESWDGQSISCAFGGGSGMFVAAHHTFVVQAWSSSGIIVQPITKSSGLPVNLHAVMHLMVVGIG